MTQATTTLELEAAALANLREALSQASAGQTTRGAEWYPTARRIVNRLARKYGVTRHRVAAIMAITSPDAQLPSNIEWTEAILRGERTYGKYGEQAQDRALQLLDKARNTANFTEKEFDSWNW